MVRGSRRARASTLLILVGCRDNRLHSSEAVTVLRGYGLDLAQVGADADFTGSAGSVLAFPVPERGGRLRGLRRIVLVGVGDGSEPAWRRAGAAAAAAARARPGKIGRSRRGRPEPGALAATRSLAHVRSGRVSAFVQGYLLGSYQAPALGRRKRPVSAGLRLLELTGAHRRAAVADARATAQTGCLARDLANAPANVKSPQWLADTAADLASQAGLSCAVFDEHRLAAEGFGGLLAVGGGSATPPRLVHLGWDPPGATRHIVLVGKGITFDTGGLSLKPAEAMVPMRTDMTGAAAVLAAVLGAARDQVPVRVTALLAVAENSVGADAYRPGDVVRVWGGRTVEIANTDAEGRIVLADALAFATATLGADVIIDVATLTGAATMGLGRGHAALYSPDDDLASEIRTAGDVVGERVWRMPLVEEYRPALNSEVADLCHVADRSNGGGGSITGAVFLREFVGTTRWAHLDIAGPARSDRAVHEVPKGATGFGARLLLGWLRTQS